MSEQSKIQRQHLARQAYIYIRQSTPHQVEQNLESQDLQYQLGHRAQTLGWSEVQVVVIDDDLGKSAISTAARQGFQRLVTAVGMGQVGIILVTDVSRLARNCSDWYRLLDLAALFGTLIGDADAVYDPKEYNDRLLLGLKGTLSEAQWYNMRSQLYAALLNKARRGELAVPLPVGYERDPEGVVVFHPNQEVQSALRLVFDQFDRLGSARAILLYRHRQGLELPRQFQSGPDRGQIEWVKPSYQAIHRILTHPAYAGAYTYGKTRRVRIPGAEQRVEYQQLSMAEWAVLKQDAFPGYISWEQYLHNQARLRENIQGANWSKGAPRAGEALLQGIVLCGRCGRRLHTRYSNQPAYVCEGAHKEYGEPLCQTFRVPHIDEAIVPVFLAAIHPAHLAAALAALEEIEAERQRLKRQWVQRLERARYEADLARRRYARVDPANRLVAAELECRWEAKLQDWQRLEQAWVQVQQQELVPLTETDKALIRQLAADLPRLWRAPTTTPAERKRLVRCLIQDVTLDAVTKPGISLIRIRWHTGATTVVEAQPPKPGCRTAQAMVARIREMAQRYPDDQIARLLNEEGVLTATRKRWTERRVANVRKQYAIPTACPYFTHAQGPRGDGLIAASEAAVHLGTTASMIAYWFRQGLLVGHQTHPRAALWVRLTAVDRLRLNGATPFCDDMVPLPQAPDVLGLTPDQMRQEIQCGRLLTYRMQIKNRWRWYIQLPSKTTTLTSIR